MLRPFLGDLQRPLASVHHRLIHAENLVAEHQRVSFLRLGSKGVEPGTALHLLHRPYLHALFLQGFYRIERIFKILPLHTLGRPECRTLDVPVGRACRNAAQVEFAHGKSIARAEDRTYVIQAPHIVQDHIQRTFPHRFVLLERNTAQRLRREFFHKQIPRGLSFAKIGITNEEIP